MNGKMKVGDKWDVLFISCNYDPFRTLIHNYLATSLIFNWQPTASAYRRRVEMDGECFFLPPPDSIRAMAGVLVPILFATCSWVSPAPLRALSSSSSRVNFSENRL
jgi:hypothetical protein